MGLKSGLQQMAYKQALKPHLAQQPTPQALNLLQLQKIAILFDASSASNTEAILAYAKSLQKMKKEVQLLAYWPEKELPEGLPYEAFSTKALNWAGVPKGEQIDAFLAHKYDLLIALYVGEQLPLDFLLQAAPSKMRLGFFEEGRTDQFDLMVHAAKKPMPALLKEIHQYLERINKK